MIPSLKQSGVFLALIAGLSLAMTASAPAADIAAGKKRAGQCAVCHGQNGVAVNPEAPNLAGESAVYIERQLTAFKSGARQHDVMSIIAKDLSDEDIQNLAAWYSAMKVSVVLPDIR
jgi:cytochrome c553